VTNLWYWDKHNKKRTIVAKWSKRMDSKFLKIEAVIGEGRAQDKKH
jgi:hypothetical protein